jgi:serine/threonine-protein kinase
MNDDAPGEGAASPREPSRRVASARGCALFVLLGALAAFVLAILLVNFILMPWHVNLGKEGEVPDVTGLTQEEAEQTLRSKGFVPGDAHYVADSVYPMGRVVDTRPRTGARVKLGRAVALDVSGGQEKTQVPQVYKMPVRRAQAAIENAGLRVGEIITVNSTKVPEGEAVSTEPGAGLRVVKGTAVRLMVSTGAENLAEMPRLEGLALDNAKDILINLGLVLKHTIEVPSPEPPNTVLDQEPTAGATVQQGDTVRLTVSKPREVKTTPPAKSKKQTGAEESKPAGTKGKKAEPGKGKR